MRRLERLLAIALFLGARKRARASDVAQHFGVSLRTVYRDLRALEQAGFPLEGNAGDGYRLSRESTLRPLALNEDEAQALAIAAQALKASAKGPILEALASASAKVEAALPSSARRRIAQLERRIATPDFARTTAPNAAMLAAIREQHAVSLSYSNPGTRQRSRRTIEPVGLVCLGEAWWIVAWCRLRGAARAFRIDCIADWKPVGHFAARAGFSFEEIVERDRGRAKQLFGY